MKTAVVILNWNTEGFLRDFLPPLLDSVKDTAGAEVVVADNASEDGSMQLMESSFPDVKTIKFSSISVSQEGIMRHSGSLMPMNLRNILS